MGFGGIPRNATQLKRAIRKSVGWQRADPKMRKKVKDLRMLAMVQLSG